jgi:hypothetical protein
LDKNFAAAKVCVDFEVGLGVQTSDPVGLLPGLLSFSLKSKQPERPEVKVFPHLEAWVQVGREIPHVKYVCQRRVFLNNKCDYKKRSKTRYPISPRSQIQYCQLTPSIFPHYKQFMVK